MSYYITANVSAKFTDKKVFEDKVQELVKNEWLKEDEGQFYFTNECNSIEDDSQPSVDPEGLYISINCLYMRNGWRVVEDLMTVAVVDGRVSSTDGTLEFTEIDENKVINLDSDSVIDGFGIDQVEYTDENEEEYEDYMYELDEAMFSWVSN